MSERMTAPHGAWPSPITAHDVARGTRRMAFPSVLDGEVWWEEARPDEDGRTTVMRRDADGTVTELLPPPWSARTRVHEYGGRSYLPVPRRDDKAIARTGIVFANEADQRLYLLERGAKEPYPLTPPPGEPGALRYADPVLSPDGKRLLCVRESHAGGTVTRTIVSLPFSGRAAQDPGALATVVGGAHFFASPTPSPDGSHLAYIRWNHPRMPWDGTELRVGRVTEEGTLTGEYTLKGGVDESVLSPLWRDNGTLYLASDWPGWWNLYESGLTGQAIALYPAEEEFHGPPWQLGQRPYCLLDSGRLVVLHGNTDPAPGLYDPDTLDLAPIDTPLTTWQSISSDGRTVVGIAASPHTPQSLVRLDPRTGRTDILRSALEQTPDPGYLPTPRTERLPGRYGAAIHANVYPPANPRADADGPAPYVVWVHGGPVSHATTELDLAKAYFTSRGIGIVDVNHGGSTGHGRSYRQRLRKEWGVVDVEDAAAAARALVDRGLADPGRLAVRGPSAGGYTALLSLTGDTFACGVSYYGVADLLRLAATTHDFESRLLDFCVGPLPGYTETYRERSPLNRVDDIDVPVLLLQGTDDPVVPPDQARRMATALGQRGIPHALIEFPGEAHGLRRASSRERALEAELAFYGRILGFEPDAPAIELTTRPPGPDGGPGTAQAQRSSHHPDGGPAGPARRSSPAGA